MDDFGFSQAVISGDKAADRALLLIGGSSTYAIVPWLADNFRTVVLLETHFYSGGLRGMSALMETYGITDVLLCLTFSTDIPGF